VVLALVLGLSGCEDNSSTSSSSGSTSTPTACVYQYYSGGAYYCTNSNTCSFCEVGYSYCYHYSHSTCANLGF